MNVAWQPASLTACAGELRDNLYNGYGVTAKADFRESGSLIVGRRYEGQFQNGLMHGEGLYVIGNGDVYEGAFQNDKSVTALPHFSEI